jgi:hypothetical protein
MPNITDPWGNPFEVGDHVCHVKKTDRYVDLIFGQVTGHTPAGYVQMTADFPPPKAGRKYICKERLFKKPEIG